MTDTPRWRRHILLGGEGLEQLLEQFLFAWAWVVVLGLMLVVMLAL